MEPTGDEVLIFSDLFKQSYNFFISNQQKAASEQIDILYRRFGDDFTKEDRQAIQEFIFLCENEQFIFEKLQTEKIDFNFVPEGTYFKRHGEEAAKALRFQLGLRDNNIIIDPYATLRRIGVHIFRRALSNKNISGLFINHPTAGRCILVNYDEDIYRQNFTLAHEVAHTIFDYAQEVSVSYGDWGTSDLKEIRANTFASNFLIPKAIFSQFGVHSWTEDQIINIAKQLQINIRPLLISMKDAGTISNDLYERYSGLSIPKADKADPELRDLPPRYMTAKATLLKEGLSTFYVRKAHECYSEAHLSAGRLAEILLTDELGLRSILELFNLKLLYDN